MKILNLISLIALLISALSLSFSASSTDIDEKDLKVVEDLFERAGKKLDKSRIIKNVTSFDIKVDPVFKLTSYSSEKRNRSYFVQTDRNGRVIYLNLWADPVETKRSLKGIEKLTMLEHLNLNNYKLDSLSFLSNLKHLKTLRIIKNDLSELSDIGRLTKLEYLDIPVFLAL